MAASIAIEPEVLTVGTSSAEIRHCFENVGEVRLHWVESGSGPLVVLLHGFPEFWYSWRHQIVALSDAGFRVVAPDLRGYNLSEKPEGVASYGIRHLTADIAGLIRACGEREAIVAGHDWGGAVAWMLAMHYPAMVRRLAILNMPHPLRFLQGLRKPRQLLRSSYVFFFQLPHLPEASIRARDFRPLRDVLTYDPVRADAFPSSDIDRYVAALSEPRALTSAINYYRAAFRGGPDFLRDQMRRVGQETLVIWGQQDRYLGPELAVPDRCLVPESELHRLQHASHWVQNDAPSRVNELLIQFCSR